MDVSGKRRRGCDPDKDGLIKLENTWKLWNDMWRDGKQTRLTTVCHWEGSVSSPGCLHPLGHRTWRQTRTDYSPLSDVPAHICAKTIHSHFTTVYSQVLIYTAEWTRVSWREQKCPSFEKVAKGIRTWALSIACPAFYRSDTALHKCATDMWNIRDNETASILKCHGWSQTRLRLALYQSEVLLPSVLARASEIYYKAGKYACNMFWPHNP